MGQSGHGPGMALRWPLTRIGSDMIASARALPRKMSSQFGVCFADIYRALT
jgi:hypothetical protein